MRFDLVLLRLVIGGVFVLSAMAINPYKGLAATVPPPTPSQATTFVQDGIYQDLSSVYRRRHKQVHHVHVVRWYDNDHVIFTFTLDQKPGYGLASLQESANHLKSVHVDVTGPLDLNYKLLHIIGRGERQTQLLGAINDESIVEIRVKLGWLTLYDQPVDCRFYLIRLPYALKDMTDYQYMYVQGIDSKGRVIADTQLTNLKFNSLFLRSKAILHGLTARALQIRQN